MHTSTSWNRKKRVGCQLCYPFEERRLQGSSRMAWNSWPVFTNPKLDGDRARAEKSLLVSSTEELIYSVPHINEALRFLNCPVELDGELYKHGWNWNQINSVVSRTVNLHPDHQQIEFWVFDIATDKPLSQIERFVMLKKWWERNVTRDMPLRLVPYNVAHSYEQVITHLDDYIANNYEGIIVRHMDAPYVRRRSTYVMKFKPKESDVYTIIGYEEEHDKNNNPKGRIGKLVFTSDHGDTFSVYSGLDDRLRDFLWSIRDTDLVGRKLRVHYQHLTEAKLPRHGQFKKEELYKEWELL